ncbi:MAG: Nif3-like dinuclear metal center hexameric protein [Defluviitaleaceae bacterium]|nr:Nif3-like dinuclear metal center hexameric protein [Defluviitaleaceae bacterium]
MNAFELYHWLENDFRLNICNDDWQEMDFNEYITENFKNRSMGLVADNTDTIDYVYTAVFPSVKIIEKIIADNKKNALLFVHHPMIWDITKKDAFYDIPKNYLLELKKRNISIYNLHVPLDANGTYGTTYNLAKAVGIDIVDEFFEYGGVKVGIIGRTVHKTIHELKKQFEAAVGHEVKIYQYGDSNIKNEIVGMIAGGGNIAEVYPYLCSKGINTYLTGVTKQTDTFLPSIEAHNSARENSINILSGTHYSTETFACIKMVEYFSKLGIAGEFIADIPSLDDV